MLKGDTNVIEYEAVYQAPILTIVYTTQMVFQKMMKKTNKLFVKKGWSKKASLEQPKGSSKSKSQTNLREYIPFKFGI